MDELTLLIKKEIKRQYVYPAMAQAFVKLFPDVLSVNREDDGGDEGLRYSKTQYRPRELIEKYLVTIES